MRSIRILLPLTVFLFVGAPAQAQLLPSFGIAGGLNFANLSDAATANLDNAVGFHAGIYADFGFGPLAVRGAVLYTRAGGITDQSGTETITVDFIGIPIDLKYVVSLPVVQPYVFIGPELRFPIGDIRREGIGLTRQMPVAVSFGAGLDVGMFIGPQAFVELRYSLDTTGFFDLEDSVRVSLFYLRLGVGI